MTTKRRLTPAMLRVLLENRPRFSDFLARRVGRDAAEDLLQEVYAKSVERGGQIRREESVVAWFFRVLRNSAIDFERRRRTEVRGLRLFAEECAIGTAELEGNVCQCVFGALAALKREHRDAIRAVDLGGIELRAFASDTSLSANAAAVRLHRGRRALALRVKDTCGACAERGCTDCNCRSRTAKDTA